MPSKTDEQKAAKEAASQAAVHQAIAVPFRIMEVALESMEVASAMVDSGLQASISDSGVAALCARSAVMGAYLNVRVNSGDLADDDARISFLERGAALQEQAIEAERDILARVDAVLG